MGTTPNPSRRSSLRSIAAVAALVVAALAVLGRSEVERHRPRRPALPREPLPPPPGPPAAANSGGSARERAAALGGEWPRRPGARARSVRRAGAPRGVSCALLSMLVPGAGQWHGGRQVRGVVLLGVVFVLLVATAVLASRGATFLVGQALRPEVLIAALVVNALLLAFRLVAVVDAWRLGRRPAPRLARGTLLGLLVAAVVAPHAAVAWYDWEAYDAITTVFSDVDPARVAPGVAFQVVSPDGVVTRIPSSPLGGDVPAALRLRPDGRPPLTPGWPRGGRLTVLLIGGDAGPGRSGLRTDTMVVATLDAETRRGALLSLPRNLADVPLPYPASSRVPGGRYPDILNSLYGWARANADAFPGGPDPGATALKSVAANLTGLRIDYYALVDFRGFVEMVDALGGVTVDVPTPVLDRVSPPEEGDDWIRIDLQPGRHHLDALEAFAYVRARSQSSDYDRIRRQRCVLTSLASQADTVRLLRAFPRLARAARDNVQTDIPRRVLPDLIRLVSGVRTRDVASLGFTPPAYSAGFADGGYPIPDIPAIRAATKRLTDGGAGATSPVGGETCG
ncbi:MAG: LCP family protein [Thermoleophilia bacterium]